MAIKIKKNLRTNSYLKIRRFTKEHIKRFVFTNWNLSPFFRFPLSSYSWITTIMIQKIEKPGFLLKCQKIYHQSTTASNKRTSNT